MRLFLDIGEMIISNSEEDYVSTVLGSCVSVCLYSNEFRVGGIIHYLLPDEVITKNLKNELYFGNLAIPILINEMLAKTGLQSSQLTAKIIGGSNSIHHEFSVGEMNIEIAKEILDNYKIPVIGEHVGSTLSRKVRFFPVSGRLQVKAIEAEVIPAI